MLRNMENVTTEKILDRSRINKRDDFIDSIILDFILKNLKKKSLPLKTFMNSFEERIIITSLKIANGNQRVAAGILGVGHTTLNEKIKKYKIQKQQMKTDLLTNIELNFKNIILPDNIN